MQLKIRVGHFLRNVNEWKGPKEYFLCNARMTHIISFRYFHYFRN